MVQLLQDCRPCEPEMTAASSKQRKEKESQLSSSKETPTQEQGKKPPIKCFNCKQEGHIAINCPGEPAMLYEARHSPLAPRQTPGNGVVRWKDSMYKK